MAVALDEEQISRALDQIRELNTELSMHEDAQVQVGALRKKIGSTKERARGLVNMIDKRITYLSDAWKSHLRSKNDYEDLEVARGAVSDPVRIGLNKNGDESFFARVNVLKDKVAELLLLDEQAAEAHKKAAADNKTLNMAADMLKEVEDRQRVMLANNEHCFSEETHPVLGLRRAIAAMDARLKMKDTTGEERKDLEKLAKDLRHFLTGLPDHGSCATFTHHSPVTSPTELRVNFGLNNDAESSSGISGTTVPTNESSSGFTTSTGASVSSSAPINKEHQIKSAVSKQKHLSGNVSYATITQGMQPRPLHPCDMECNLSGENGDAPIITGKGCLQPK